MKRERDGRNDERNQGKGRWEFCQLESSAVLMRVSEMFVRGMNLTLCYFQACCSEIYEGTCSDSTATCHQQGPDETSVAVMSQCTAAQPCSERLSPVESLSNTAKCPTADTVQQKSSKELAKVKKREDKGIGKKWFVSCLSSATFAFLQLW